MSVSNPLIKELKGWTRKLIEWGKEIDDENVDLYFFCQCLEKCLQKGIIVHFNSIGFPKMTEAWNWMEEIANKRQSSSYTFSLAVEQVKQNYKVRTYTGQLRLLIRVCLTRKCLHVPVELLVRTPLLAAEYYNRNSILGDDILGEILLSVLLQCSKLNFKLNLRNASFLDDTWHLPECMDFELVPCDNIGISVCFMKGRAIVASVDKNSVAAEDDKVEAGDVLDEINGNILTSSTKGDLPKIMRKTIGLPITVHVVKLYQRKTNNLYGPLVRLIKLTNLDCLMDLLKQSDPVKVLDYEGECKSLDLNKTFNAGFSVRFCGSIFIGAEGDVKQIENAIWNLLKSREYIYVPVKFECLEIGVRVTRDSDNVVICKQSYMEISSCGRTANIPHYFAFIAGDTNCNVATKFDAYVFYHQNENEVQTILQSLGQGFQRTHFAV